MSEVDRAVDAVVTPVAGESMRLAVARAVVQKVGDAHKIGPASIFGRSRKQHVVAARVDAYRALRRLKFSYPEIGRCFGRHHTSVIETLQAHDRRGARAGRIVK